ncbi:MAG: hypothetical protein ACI8S6_001525 [Myxococcota bacterium]|jgi:hypothetical protein
MMSGALVGEVAGVLSGLALGERAWFWFCPAVEPPASGLLVSPLALDPLQEQLREAASSEPLPEWARVISGVLSVEQDGRIALLAAAAIADDLEELADWVDDHYSAHPALARLRGASLRVAGDDGSITAIHEDDALWESIPSIQIAENEQAAAVLGALADGGRAWFWMTDAGPDCRAMLVMQPVEVDTDGVRFRALVRAARQRSSSSSDKGGRVVQGVVQRQGAALRLTTDLPAKEWDAVVAALLGQGGAGMRPLRQAQLAYLKDGALRKLLPLPPHRELCETIDTLASGAGWFWFAPARHGAPLLVARTERDGLKEAGQAAGLNGGVRGRILAQPDGTLELQRRPGNDDFPDALLGWAKSEAGRWPKLRQLRSAALTTRET